MTDASTAAAQRPDYFTPARLWIKGENFVQCRLCAHYCRIKPNLSGNCGVRANFGGELFTAVGNSLAAINIDPVEKKPLFHFLPGSKTFSVGSPGCNFHCKFCQNSGISQIPGAVNIQQRNLGSKVTPQGLVAAAIENKTASISYTYNEPTVFFELMQATAEAAGRHGLRNIMVSNGYMSAECFDSLKDLIQAANFDLKAFSADFYKNICGGRLNPVLRTLKAALRQGWWIELTTLVISEVNDRREELDALAAFIAGELGPDVPWHVSRFRPAYLMRNTPATRIASLERALESGKKHGLKYVYVGNLPGHSSENTFCPSCGLTVLERVGFNTRVKGLGVCPECQTKIAGVWI
ncbi:MAG: AmmeMemoRadiSam system radical SAM enzyme [Deltaproteobacteria bacterium]|jgi:pyruvate formate lyase activating enzyme|nr:AmmeMemoRadiSam system radical SAM enzyme [Deltaproteobacteria bacterium]